MNNLAPEQLEQAVAAICPDIRDRVEARYVKPDERRLWWELSCCLLSSQVPYSSAVAAADVIDARQLLLADTVEPSVLAGVLGSQFRIDGRYRRYRFPVARAQQLAATRAAVTRTAGSLSSLLSAFETAGQARLWFVENAPGIGPKQASMFLRNTGVTYELAVLDRHVLNYMAALGLYEDQRPFISGLPKYRRHEVDLRRHAESLGYAVGLLDWAIWIVMRAAQCAESELHLA